jgi:hypothetical protein
MTVGCTSHNTRPTSHNTHCKKTNDSDFHVQVICIPCDQANQIVLEPSQATVSVPADSPRLREYRTYDPKTSLAVLIWGCDPPASYVSLLMPPWAPAEEKVQAVSTSSKVAMFVNPCTQCGSTERVQKCSRCGNAFYCDRDCQRLHWPTHKQECVAKK